MVGGKIYIGDPGVDPILNPKNVYDNRELTGAALAQPVIIDVNGRATNKMWVSGKYSLQIDSSADVLKYEEAQNGIDEQVGNTLLIDSLGINDVTVTGSPTVTELVDNQTYIFTAPANNTGAMTLKIDTLAAKDIRKGHDQLIESGDIKADQKIVVVYNSTDDWFEIQSNVLGAVFSGNVSIGQDIVISEQSDHSSTPAAEKGYLWVKNDTPNSLVYTDDAGTDNILRPTLSQKVIDIGDWDMEATAIVNVTHGLTLSQIRTINCTIRNDAGTNHYPINDLDSSSPAYIGSATATVVGLFRVAAGFFDSNDFNATSYNRGWVTIQYEA